MTQFRLHDKVFHFRHGNGEIVTVDPGRRRPIGVIFEGGICEDFSGQEAVTERLYHGHDPEIIVKEQPPERKRRLYLNISGRPGDWHVSEYESLSEAKGVTRVINCAAAGIEVEVDA